MRVWIDLANSPHPMLFEPVSAALRERGAEVLLTARDHAQTAELARERWPEVEILGGASRSGRVPKAAAIAERVATLRRWARRNRPDVALSHNSYAQIAAARLLRIPAVTAMDYEHQSANHLAFRLARTVLVPEAVPDGALRAQGARGAKLVRYPGFKEMLYLGRFEPDGSVLERLGIEPGPGEPLVVVRSAPAGATYHPGENELALELLRRLAAQPAVHTVLLPRHPEQRRAAEALGLPRCIVAPGAVDGRSLLCAADLFVGAGGTMTREAALLGVPSLSAFEGPQPAVDRRLVELGLLGVLRGPEDVEGVAPRERAEPPLGQLREAGERIEREFVAAVEAAARG